MQIAEKIFSTISDYIGDVINAFLDITLIIVTAVTITGCSSAPNTEVERATYHPSWPTPYQVCDVDWKIFVIEEEPYVALSFDDNLKLASCTEDLIRYLSELNIKFCTYRPKEDTRCAKVLSQEKDPT